MKLTFTLLLQLMALTMLAETYTIKAGNQLKIDKPDFTHCNATIKNKSTSDLEVSVRDLSCGELLSGFGLNGMAKEDLYIDPKGTLFIRNTGEKDAKVNVTFEETEEPKPMVNAVQFTLQNPSTKSIPLIIPNVMNPNLSPLSKSGVYLEYGQEILFKYKGKKQVLLVVSEEIKTEEIINVAALIKKRKKEIDEE